MSDWLEIAKRKPPEHEDVLLWASAWGRASVGYMTADGLFELAEKSYHAHHLTKYPTHWQRLPESPVLPPPPLTWTEVDRVEPEFIETVLLWNEGWGRTFIGHMTLSSEYVDIESVPFDPQPTYWMLFPKHGPKELT